GLGLDDTQFEGRGQLHADRAAVVELGEQDELGREPLRGIAQRLLIEHEHVVVGLVHEVVVQAVVVEVLELVRLERCRLDLVGGAEAVLEELARAQVPQLGLDERAQVPGRVVVEVDDAARVAVHDDHGSPSDLRGGDRHSRTLPCVGVRKRFSPQRSQEGSIGSTLPGRFDVAWDEDLDGAGEYAGVDGRAAGGVAVDLDGDGGLGADGDLAGAAGDEAGVAAGAVACGVPEGGGEVGEVAVREARRGWRWVRRSSPLERRRAAVQGAAGKAARLRGARKTVSMRPSCQEREGWGARERETGRKAVNSARTLASMTLTARTWN